MDIDILFWKSDLGMDGFHIDLLLRLTLLHKPSCINLDDISNIN